MRYLFVILREKNTRNYLIAYTMFNTGAHVAAISTVYSLDPDFDGEEEGAVDKARRTFHRDRNTHRERVPWLPNYLHDWKMSADLFP